MKGTLLKTNCFVDSATIYEMTALTRHSNIKENNNWNWQGCLTATTALINMPFIKLAPAPSTPGSASDTYGFMMKRLADIIGEIGLNSITNVEAIKETKLLVQNKIDYVRKAVQSVKNIKCYNQWLQEGINYSWTEHSLRLGGLFNKEFIKEIALTMNIPQKDLKEIWNLSCNIDYLKKISKERIDNGESNIMKDAFLISALLRGYYHKIYAKKSNLQIIHHPFRKSILFENHGTTIQKCNVSNTEYFFSTIILAGALKETSQEKRILAWIENIRKTRIPIMSGEIDLPNKEKSDEAIDLAIEVAKKLNIQTNKKIFNDIVDLLFGIGLGVISSFVLQGWMSFMLGVSTSWVSNKTKVGERIVNSYSNSDLRLRKLANSGPGQIEHIWESAETEKS